MSKDNNKTQESLKSTNKMRLEDIPIERIPWKEMVVGGIYQRKDGRYYIYAGRADVYHKVDNSLTLVAETKFYTYIYLDYPTVLTLMETPDTIKIIAGSAKIRSSEYRDIARSMVGMLPNFTVQPDWQVADFIIKTTPLHTQKGTTKLKVKFSGVDAEILKKAVDGKKVSDAKKTKSGKAKGNSRKSAVASTQVSNTNI